MRRLSDPGTADHAHESIGSSFHSPLSLGLGRVRADVAPSVRSFPIARHVAFYVAREGGIAVLRVLHPSVDVGDAFADGLSTEG